MKKSKRGKYFGISLPEGLIERIKGHIEKRGEYKQITEFVREAIREKLRREKFEAHSYHPKVVSSDDVLEFLDKRYGYKRER